MSKITVLNRNAESHIPFRIKGKTELKVLLALGVLGKGFRPIITNFWIVGWMS